MKITKAVLALFVAIAVLALGQVSASTMIGEEGVISSSNVSTGGQKFALVAVDKKVLDEFRDAELAGDEDGLNQLTSSGRLFPVKVGTRVKILMGGSFGTLHVRILEGAHAGRSGYIPSGMVE